MARFDRMDNGSPAEEEMKARAPKVGRSAHDFSTSVAGNCLLGMLVPVDWFPVVPSETVQMSINGTVEFRNPTNRPILNGFRTYFHVRYNRLVDLWEGAKNFVDKGRSGNIDLQLPNCVYRGSFTNDSYTVMVNANTPMSLVNFLKMPVELTQKKIGTSSGTTVNRSPLRQFQASVALDVVNLSSYVDIVGSQTNFLPAPLFFSYQRNWRDFYSPKNLLQNNKFWFPDNEDHFILSYSCTDAVAIRYEDEDFNSVGSSLKATYQCLNLCGAKGSTSVEMAQSLLESETVTPEPNNPSVQPPSIIQDYKYSPNLCGIKFVQFRGDRFTTSSPFPDLIRGDVPILQLTEDNFVRAYVTKSNSSSDIGKKIPFDGTQPVTNNPLARSVVSNQGISNGFSIGSTNDDLRLGLLVPESSVTMSDLYTLETLTAFKRKLGMTNGDYNEAVKAQFGYDPHVHSREATYIGGFYMDMNLSTVVQQSETSSTPLGTKAGNGLSAGSGNIGSFDVPDFGYITTYMFVVPNVYYTQGKYRFLSEQSAIELYFPLFNNLPAQAIRNDEIFISGGSSTDSAPFSYEDRYAHYKSRSNFVCGFMGLPVSKARYDSAKIMARRFSSRPSFNAQFVSMIPENQDMNVFSVLDEPPLDFNVNIQVRRVFPGPYMAIEGSLSSPLLNA